jgi:uncharacterized SAM-binding protein YcdF (DUF218 family)
MADVQGALRRGLKRRIVVWGLASLVIAWLVGFMFFNMSLWRSTPEITDKDGGIVVLTGGDQRLKAAMDLLNRGYGKRLLVTGVNRATARAKLRSFMAKSTPGLFDCCVDLGREAQDTIGNAQETASWVVKNNYHSIVVVTASYHMPRAMVELRYAVPASCMLIPYPVFTDTVRLTDWWRWSGTTRLLAEEYTKYIASVARVSLMRAILRISGS